MADATRTPDVSMDFDTLSAQIVMRRAKMPKRLAQVAEFVLAQPDEVALGTAAGLAARIGVQASTLVRFSQVLGLSGFSELQALCRKKLQQRWPDYEERIRALRDDTQADHSARLFAGFSEASIASILRLREQWDSVRFSDAVASLSDSDTIYLVGNRRSFPITSYLGYMFGRLGIRHQLLAGLGDMDGNALDTIGPRDAMVAVGFAPYAEASVVMAQRAADKGMRIISITDSPFSPLARLATHWLEVVEEDHAGFRGLGASFCLCMTLAAAIAEQRPASKPI
jgi:DNA-binding MurR/RpiR family transcriptional regulator